MNESTKGQSAELVSNDLIGQIMLSAGFTKHYFSGQIGIESNDYIINRDRLRNFAELIIQECQFILNQSIIKDSTSQPETIRDFCVAYNRGLQTGSELIKLYFGLSDNENIGVEE